MLTKEDYTNVLMMQDAVNLSAIIIAWAEVMKKINDEAWHRQSCVDWKNNHPINVLYASKVASLTGSELSNNFFDAYKACEDFGR